MTSDARVQPRPQGGEGSFLDDWRLSRRRFLGLGLVTAAGLATAGRLVLNAPGTGRTTVTWLSPRRTLAVADDYPFWVASELGYMDRLGIDLRVEANAAPPALDVPAVAGVGITLPAPAELANDADRGLTRKAVFQLCASSVFGFALAPRSARRAPRELSGAAIAVGDASWESIVRPLLAEAGVDARSVTLVVAGPRWLEVTAEGRADAALSWRGLEQSGPAGLRHMLGERWTKLPANAFAVDDLEALSGHETAALTRFLQATVMGLEFARQNPRAAAAITYRAAPGLAEVASPGDTLRGLVVAAGTYGEGRERGLPWGYHEPARWQRYVDAAEEAGMVKSFDSRLIYTNRLITEANSVDRAQVALDASTYPVSRDFSAIPMPRGG